MNHHTPYQQKIIRRFYQNYDAIQQQRFADLIAELYLAEGKKVDRVWRQIAELLKKLEFPETRIAHMLLKKDPTHLPGILKELEASG